MAPAPDTIEWREALALLAEWQAAPADLRPVLLDRLCDRHPPAAATLRRLATAMVQAEAEGFLTGAASPWTPRGAVGAGSVCGRWTLQSRLGSGGMGDVWLARRSDGLHDGLAAIKLLHAGPRTALTEARFAAEGRVLARLEHPHIARLLDIGLDPDGQRYIVLEHVAGVPITDWCAARQTPLAGRLALFLQVCDAVAHAHAQLVVHRDIKPSNILVTAEGQAKLLDFGIAKLLDDDAADLTRAGLPALTPDYAAPEQLLGGAVTVATDVHALGGLLFELLTGTRPFADAGASAEHRLRAALDGVPRQASQVAAKALAPLLRGDIDHIVERALRRQPAERYPSVRALADDIQRHCRHEPVSVRAPSWRYRAGRFVRRHRAGVSAGTVALLALLLGSGTALWQAEQARTAALQARNEAAVANATRAFLLGLFQTVDIGSSRTRQALDRSVRDLLIDSARQLVNDRQLPPPLRLELLSTIGRLHAKLSLIDSADQLESEALVLAEQLHGPDGDITLQAMIERAGTLSQMGRRGEGLAMFADVAARSERSGRAGSLIHVRALHEVGETAFLADDARAAGYLQRAVDAYARQHPSHPERVMAHVMLMRLHLREENYSAFDLEAARTEALIRDLPVDRGYDRYYFASTVAARWQAVGDDQRAQALLRDAAPVGLASLGERHPHTIRTERWMAVLAFRLGARQAARERLAELHAMPQERAVWSAQEEDRAAADLAWLDGDFGLARTMALRELAMPGTPGSEQPQRLMRLAEIETALGHHDVALAAAQAAVTGFAAQPGPSSLKHLHARVVQAEALLAAGRVADARLALQEVLAAATARLAAPAGPMVGRLRARALVGLSNLHRSGDPVAALAFASRALAQLSADAAVLDDRLLWAAAQLASAQALQALGRSGQASTAAAAAVARLQSDQSPASARLAQANAVLAGLR